MIIDLKDIIDDDLNYTYFSQKAEHAMTKISSLKSFPFRNGRLDYEGYDFYCPFLSMIFHLKITPHVAKILNKEIIPSFCYTRLYFPGSKLNVHKDRPACEITVSHCHYGKPWKIFILEDEFITQTGTSICYEGIDKEHCRISPTLSRTLYSFYHWVEKGGKYEEFKYDTSEKLEKVYMQIKKMGLDKSYI